MIAEVRLDIERFYDSASSPLKKQLNISQKIEVLTKAVLELNEEIEELKKSQTDSDKKDNKADNNRKIVNGFDDFLNSKEAADLLDMQESTIQAWARAEKIPCIHSVPFVGGGFPTPISGILRDNVCCNRDAPILQSHLSKCGVLIGTGAGYMFVKTESRKLR